MKLNQLKPPKGAKRKKKRVGCGPGSGHGKTACRGHKGAGQRKGKEFDARFEGGQMPYYRRIPKRGFYNITKKEFELVNLAQLAKFPAQTEITPETLVKANLIKKGSLVKVLGNGEISVPLTLKLHAFSQKALEKIEKAGGKVFIIDAPKVRPDVKLGN
uniref:Large ribosomal subunit protein uL15 n=1 Tax=candidate division WOR-3 bacterium TaxID=2052148 RepID=A0A7C6EDY7_UNCW3